MDSDIKQVIQDNFTNSSGISFFDISNIAHRIKMGEELVKINHQRLGRSL